MSAHALKPAERMNGIALSTIIQITEQAARMRAAGQDVIALSAGEPDFPTPGFVIDAAMAAARAGQTRYTATAGTPELRAVIAAEHGCTPDNVIVSNGAKQVLANALMATLDPGDEVILPTPFWTTYGDIVRFAGGTGVQVPCPMAQGFKLSPAALEAAITPRTRWVMFNSPSNPTGAVYSAEDIAALEAVLLRHPHVWVISDEIYAHLAFENFASFATAAPQLKDRLLVVSGASKAWSMTGWRVGWGVGPAELVSTMASVQGQFTSGASSISQAAALAALTGDRQLLADRCAAFRERRGFVCDAVKALPGFDCPVPKGAFYVFPSIAGALREGEDDIAYCQRILEHTGVALVPGSAFGLDGHVRLSFAYSREQLNTAFTRIMEYLSSAKSG